MFNGAVISAVAATIAASSTESEGAKYYANSESFVNFGGDFLKVVIVLIVCGLCGLFIVRNVKDIITAIKERKRARPPDAGEAGKEENLN